MIPGYFDGSYDDFDAKRQQYYMQEALNLDVAEARSILMSVVPQYAVEAWKTCMAAQAVGQLQAWVSRADEDSAIVKVRFIAGQGHEPLSRTEVTVDPGAKIYGDEFSPNEAFDGETSIHVIRAERYKAVKGTVSGRSNGGAFTTDFYVPKAPQLVRKAISQTSNFGAANVGTYKTPVFSGRAELKLYGTASATWQVKYDGHHWVHCVIRKDGTVFHYTGEIGIAKGQSATATTKEMTLDASNGQQYSIQVDTNNDGAKAEELKLHISGWKEVWE